MVRRISLPPKMDTAHAAAQSDRNGNPHFRRPWRLPPQKRRGSALGRTGCRADRFVLATIEADTPVARIGQRAIAVTRRRVARIGQVAVIMDALGLRETVGQLAALAAGLQDAAI